MSLIPQTMTTMEAGFTVNQADAEEFWRHQERMGPVAAAASGFLAVIGGPIARSPWLYFCGKWQTPDLMDQWYRDGKHKPMMKAAHDRWFGACYIRKWRLPDDGEQITGPVSVRDTRWPIRTSTLSVRRTVAGVPAGRGRPLFVAHALEFAASRRALARVRRDDCARADRRGIVSAHGPRSSSVRRARRPQCRWIAA